jgi:hypothetical protein
MINASGFSAACAQVTQRVTQRVTQWAAQPAPQPIPHGAVASGDNDIKKAWLAEPTSRYRHDVLGDAVEGLALVVETVDGRRVTVRLEDGSVFEDTTPRLADIDGDGRDEVWTVRSNEDSGARIEAYQLAGVGEASGPQLVRRYSGPAIGQGFRWLNPVGVADLDGDGQREIVWVQTPHLRGLLMAARPHGQQLDVVAVAPGYSNRSIGSSRLDLAALADVDARPGAEVVVPDLTHRRLAVVQLQGERWVVLYRSEPGQRVRGGLRVVRDDGRWVASYLTDGDERVIVPLE